MEDEKINALVNVADRKILSKAYDDLLSPASKKIGRALATVFDMGNTVLAPIQFVNEKTKVYFANNLKKYQNSLEEIPDGNIVEVPTEISIPILNRFQYVTNDDLSNAFVNLLTKASNSETISLAHPGFIVLIDRLSSDEAKLLSGLSKKAYVPVVYLKATIPISSAYSVFKDRTGLEFEITLSFPENIKVYLDNLQSLGLIERFDYSRDDEETYTTVINQYPDDMAKFRADLSEEYKDISWFKEVYEITDFGRLFLSVVV